ncbi:DJC13 protein, partial [Polypterus senegalus]|nr:DJC13 protein [Polypterus senegalus]
MDVKWRYPLHLFASEQRDDIIKSAIEHAGNYIGITLRVRKDNIGFEQFVNFRLGKYSTDDSVTSLAEFVVQKISPRHSEPVKRTLALTETCLVERDPATYNIVTLKPFGESCSMPDVNLMYAQLRQFRIVVANVMLISPQSQIFQFRPRSSPKVSVKSLVVMNVVSILECHVDNFYPKEISIEWLRASQPLPSQDNPQLERNPDGTFSAVSSYHYTPTPEDSGVAFSCRVRQEYQERPLEETFHLQFRKRASVKLTSINLPQSQKLISCDVEDFYSADAEVIWKKNGHPVDSTEQRKDGNFEKRIYHKLDATEMKNEYMCEVSQEGFNDVLTENRFTQKDECECTTQTIVLTVIGVLFAEVVLGLLCYFIYLMKTSPKVSVKSLVVMNVVNVLECHVDNFYPSEISIEWLRASQPLPPQDKPQPERNLDGTFSAVSRYHYTPTSEDSDVAFSCKVRQECQERPLEETFHLQFRKRASVKLTSINLPQSQKLISCVAEDFYPADAKVIWKKNGHPVNSTEQGNDGNFKKRIYHKLGATEMENEYTCEVSQEGFNDSLRENRFTQKGKGTELYGLSHEDDVKNYKRQSKIYFGYFQSQVEQVRNEQKLKSPPPQDGESTAMSRLVLPLPLEQILESRIRNDNRINKEVTPQSTVGHQEDKKEYKGTDGLLPFSFYANKGQLDPKYIRVIWKHNGKEIVRYESEKMEVASRAVLFEADLRHGNASLFLPWVIVTDEGNYECEVNYASEYYKQAFKFNVLAPPKISVMSFVVMNVMSILECHVDNFYPAEISIEWLRDSQSLYVQDKPQPERNPDGTYSVVSFFHYKPTLEDHGVAFCCRVRQDGQEWLLEETFRLKFRKRASVKLTSLSLPQGQKLITCIAEDFYPADAIVTWKKNGHPTNSTEAKEDGTFVKRVYHKMAATEMENEYICEASQEGFNDSLIENRFTERGKVTLLHQLGHVLYSIEEI